MKIEISRPIKHIFNTTTTELPRSTGSFLELFSFDGRGELINASFKFNSEKVQFKVEIDGVEMSSINIENFEDFLGNNRDDVPIKSPITYNKRDDIVTIDFGIPIEFYKSLKFLARANSNSNARDIEAYQVFYTQLEEDV